MKTYIYSRKTDEGLPLGKSGETIRWWLAEYDPDLKIAFGYVTGFFEDEWGDISLEELEGLEFVIRLTGIGDV